MAGRDEGRGLRGLETPDLPTSLFIIQGFEQEIGGWGV